MYNVENTPYLQEVAEKTREELARAGMPADLAELCLTATVANEIEKLEADTTLVNRIKAKLERQQQAANPLGQLALFEI